MIMMIHNVTRLVHHIPVPVITLGWLLVGPQRPDPGGDPGPAAVGAERGLRSLPDVQLQRGSRGARRGLVELRARALPRSLGAREHRPS